MSAYINPGARTSDFKKGDLVTYHGYGNREYGVVSSVNDICVFVKYDNAVGAMVTGDEPYASQATDPRDLTKR